MFPFDEEDDDIELDEREEQMYREYEIDYTTGELTGRIVEGLDALKVWMYLALNTQRYRFDQYSWNYGHEMDDLIGTAYVPDYIQMEAARITEECLMVNEHIMGIEDFTVAINEEKVSRSFTVKTDYGEVTFNDV